MGKLSRIIDAHNRMRDLSAVEDETLAEIDRINQIESTIKRESEQHRLNIEYLTRFGVAVDERQRFQEILKQVQANGALTLRQAAQLVEFERRLKSPPLA